MKKFLVIPLVILVVLAMTTAAFAQEFSGKPLVATLTGAAEAPGPGDPDGFGYAEIRLNYGQNQVCWNVTYEDIGMPAAAHIHIAPAGSPGPVVVPLSPIGSGCTTVAPELMKAIMQNPENYYVNVHTAAFPAGAIRGQLSNVGQNR